MRRLLACCTLSLYVTNLALANDITFAEQIAPLIHQNCTNCHRPGQAGPFPLVEYQDIAKRARTIHGVLHSGYMPPWQPVKGHGEFADERRLTEEQIRVFDAWVAAGKPKGDLQKMPAMPAYPNGWQLGEPDLVVKMRDPYPVAADGPDQYRSFVLRVDLPETKWVKAIEFRPSARSVVHHAIFFTAEAATVRPLDGADGKPGLRRMTLGITGALGGYVPGTTPRLLPEGLAMRLPAGSDIIMQTHFHPSGKAEIEQGTVALYFAEEPPTKALIGLQVPPLFGRAAGIDIPPGEKNYTITDRYTLPVSVEAIGVGGHAHYLCREMRMKARLPDGQQEWLLDIDDWDLNWQDRYYFKHPLRLPAGTEIQTTLIYDNSSDNPENPFLPPQRIRWGRESTDEMGSVTLMVTPVDQGQTNKLRKDYRGYMVKKLGGGAVRRFLSQPKVTEPASSREQQDSRNTRNQGDFFRRFDRNQDGKIQRSEVPERFRERFFGRIDRNADGVIDQGELERIKSLLKFRGGDS